MSSATSSGARAQVVTIIQEEIPFGMSGPADIYLQKAEQSLAGAESEFANGRYNNCANRCYYSCFQAAVAALLSEGLGPSGHQREWSHRFVQATFAGGLVRRRKSYPASMRNSLSDLLVLREIADYKADNVSQR